MLAAMIRDLVGHSSRLLLASIPLGAVGVIGAVVALSGCGDGGSKPTSKSPKGASSSRSNDKGPSIGDIAASQGGIAALGGGGNREEGTGVESAMTGPLRAEEVDKKKPVKLDGVLKEWHKRSAATETVSGSVDGIAFEVAMLYDDTKIYIAGEIQDPKLARSSKHGGEEDHVSMTIAFPAGRGALKAYEIGLWPGKPGDSAGAVKWLAGPTKGQDVAGARLVEADEKRGCTFEAAIPWSSFAEAHTMRVGLRGAFRYHDGNGSSIRGVLGTGHGSVDKPGDLPPLPTAAEDAVVEGLLQPKNLAGDKPKIDVYADLAGDERKERVSVFGRFFTICGPGYRGGHQFFWREVSGDIVSIETRELTGRGKEDLVVRRRVIQSTAIHEIVEVWSLVPNDEPSTVFAHQIAIVSSDGKKKITNALRVSAKEIEVELEPAVGWDAASFKETVAGDIEPILVPWGTVKSQTFKFEKNKFAKANEVSQAGQTSATKPEGTSSSLPRDVPTPNVQKGSDAGKQVLEAYFKDQNVPAGTKPRFDLDVHVDGDTKAERVLLVGRDVVVLGPSFKGGTGYARLSLTQFADEKDVTELTARDVTGDGAAEIIVRGVRHVTGTSGDKVDVDAMFIYQVKSGGMARVFGVETGREMDGKRVQGQVQFVPAKSGKGFDIDVRPGVAKGWTAETYPWPQDKPATGSVEPLLLPWGKIPSVKYTFNGTAYAPP